MKKQTFRLIIDVAILASSLGAIFTGTLLWLFLSKGSGPDAQKWLWGLHRHEWGDLHLFFALVFVALTVIHLILQWRWISCVIPREWRNDGQAMGFLKTFGVFVGALGIIIGAYFLFMKGSVDYSEREGAGRRRGRSVEIDGQALESQNPSDAETEGEGRQIRRRGRRE